MLKIMRIQIKYILFILLSFVALMSNAQVGINTTAPNAQLEIKSSDQANPTITDGLIIPKIDIFPSTNPTAAQQGMMVYLTTTSGVNFPGFYYWDNKALPSPNWVAIGNGSSSSFTHYIGELYGGGIVVAVWKESGVEKGLIASLVNMKTSSNNELIGWSGTVNALVPLPGATSLVNGMSNTNAIVAQNATANMAATICKSFNGGGFNDWYLPSIWELDECYKAAFVVSSVLGSLNSFQYNTYWSSTERDANYAYYKYFDAGYNYYSTKGNTYYVRAVRRF